MLACPPGTRTKGIRVRNQAAKPKVLKCAIYTRKSSEEGLEQDFNSLHAQRESCEAYIKSQKHEGWMALPNLYDDGGYSGGSIERPALKKLLPDIQSRAVDVVIVYKVDRLTRSLADFAKIVEIFDAAGVSFASVTQQFNTTTSMGRLTLNVLLSFAQFEREVTGERIRDKIAASKQKGMWMGGWVPIGYGRKDLCLSEIKSGYIRDAIRRGPGGKEYALPSLWCAIGAHPCPRPSACASHYSSERKISESGADVPRLRQ